MNPFPRGTEARSGQLRRVGVELEFIGLSARNVADILADHLSGTVVPVSEYEYQCQVGETTYVVEVDLSLLKKLGREIADDPSSDLKRWSVDMLATATRPIVPVEIVTPPLSLEALEKLDGLLDVLRDRGALGTHHNRFYAFGLHLNPGVPSFDPAVILAYIRAFICLNDWLTNNGRVDFSRRVTPFINSFPSDYEALVLDPAYQPDLTGLIDDYLEHNDTRNRALDMLPLFAELDQARVRARLPDEKINPRPTFHYRLPNCEIDCAEWDLAGIWNDWLQVEYLANDHGRLQRACFERLKNNERLISSFDDKWLEQSKQWLTDLSSV